MDGFVDCNGSYRTMTQENADDDLPNNFPLPSYLPWFCSPSSHSLTFLNSCTSFIFLKISSAEFYSLILNWGNSLNRGLSLPLIMSFNMFDEVPVAVILSPSRM